VQMRGYLLGLGERERTFTGGEGELLHGIEKGRDGPLGRPVCAAAGPAVPPYPKNENGRRPEGRRPKVRP
jgi:hypothetical protein